MFKTLNKPITVVRANSIRLIATLGLLFASSRLTAQTAASAQPHITVRPFVGAYLPTGDQRDFLKDAVLVGTQAAWAANENFALIGSFGWTPSEDKLQPGARKIDAYQYDLGVEARSGGTNVATLISPFIGAGIGGRTYSYRNSTIDSKTNFDGYGAVGVDAGAGVVGIRLEVRDYVSRFQPLIGGGDTKTRNDVSLFAGLGVKF